ncbi:CocE/NonD family hydrolase [Sphingomonas lenta]|uniref:X-Pro dipeptidyl-peptidase n=1 Tax=Sphingomonas lenta TaxID=1141887 RepID=A0A2A2SDX5_9SPHN|nr:CocE/NonD family hydrolase [Sphingomonas lenta]PAX07231.1 X-Pro dipeptidyl-peptidase [Sphingomonas lenta]
MRKFTIALLAAAGFVPAYAQTPAPAPAQAAAESPFTVTEVMIPMRDGAKLHTVITAPRNATGPLPVLFSRTPYGVRTDAPPTVPRSWAALAKDGYIFVNQSMRGRFKSDGVFTLSTAVGQGATDEATDAYDSIDWLVKNVPGNSGKVGMWGISYPGFTAAVALARPHPALKAVSPQAAWTDYWLNDDLHRYGALRLSYATDWLYLLQKNKENAEFSYDEKDAYDWFLKQGPVENIDKQHFRGAVPMFTSLLEHPNHDAFYKRQDWSKSLGRTTVPTLNVTGYWDQEDPWGSWRIHETQQRNDPDNLAVMVAGPWSHGYWSRFQGTNLGRIDYGVNSTGQFLEEVQAPFFAYWLHGRGAKPDYELKSFQSGSWTWKSYPRWPIAAAQRDLYLRADGTLGFERGGEGCRSYVSDPADPVPYRPRPISTGFGPEWQWWEAEDQRYLSGRKDVLSWVGAPLTEDLTVTGQVLGRLLASTSGTDSDFVVKLIDVFPDGYKGADGADLGGYQLPVAMEIRRGKFLTSGERPQALRPNRVVTWDVPLRERDHVFKRGHRLMVQVQSSWFPVIDRNPQTFVPNIARARPEQFVKATQRVCAGSKVVLPLVK